MVLSDAVLRKLPGALGHEQSAVEESFSVALGGRSGVSALHAPGRATAAGACPRSCSPGNHQAIEEWRRERSRERGDEAQRADQS